MKHPKTPMSKRKKNSNFLTGELIICSLICILGLLALTHIMNSSTDHSPKVYTPPHTNTSPKTARMSMIKAPVIERVEELEITGVLDAGEKLNFHIPDYHRKISYEFDLGNGKVITAEKAKVTYSYPESGKYRVKLWGSFDGRRKLLGKKTIKIVEAIQVSEDAYKEVD